MFLTMKEIFPVHKWPKNGFHPAKYHCDSRCLKVRTFSNDWKCYDVLNVTKYIYSSAIFCTTIWGQIFYHCSTRLILITLVTSYFYQSQSSTFLNSCILSGIELNPIRSNNHSTYNTQCIQPCKCMYDVTFTYIFNSYPSTIYMCDFDFDQSHTLESGRWFSFSSRDIIMKF